MRSELSRTRTELQASQNVDSFRLQLIFTCCAMHIRRAAGGPFRALLPWIAGASTRCLLSSIRYCYSRTACALLKYALPTAFRF